MTNIDLKRSFKIWAYSVSHKTLIIRSEIQFPDVTYENVYFPNCTIDLEFWDVNYIQSVNDFEEVILTEEKNFISKEITDILINKKLKVYNLKTSNKNNYIVAGGCIVGKSNWTIEDKTQNFRLEYEEILHKL